MPVSEEDDAVYRKRISEVLIEHGFDWVVAQAEAEIADGKPLTKQVTEPEFFSQSDDAQFAVRAPRTKRASLITSEPYSEAEGLEILLKAVEAALIQRADLEVAVLSGVKGVTAIDFQPETSREVEGGYLGTKHTLDRDRIEPAVDLRRRTQLALEGMRGRLRDSTR
jgi:hypothetical protein